MIPLAASEEIIDASGAAPRIEAMLPLGVRARQLSVRTLLAGMCLAQADGRPAHLTRVHQALTSLPEGEQRRLGVIAPSSSRTCTPTTADPRARTTAPSSPTATSTARPRPAPCWN
jgi:hypothetical protein